MFESIHMSLTDATEVLKFLQQNKWDRYLGVPQVRTNFN